MMARTKKPPRQKKPQFSIHTISLTTEETKALQQLSQDASDFLGRSISGSAIIRALIRQVVKQGPPAADALFIEVERELKAGVRWGKQEGVIHS
jgi:hypothetical protein